MTRSADLRDVARTLSRASELDVALALAAFVGLLADHGLSAHPAHSVAAAVALSLLTAFALVLRRSFPLGVLAVVVACMLAGLALFHPAGAAVAVVMLAVYTVGLQGRRLRSLLVGAAMAPVVAAAVLVTSDAGAEPGPTLARLALLIAALAAGDARRGRQALERAVAQESEREREAQALHRFDEERLRLAHELHDTVAHALVGINVRAAAAVHLQRKHPGDSFEALEEIARSSADALSELRSTLKILRPAGLEATPLRPPQSLADLQELIDGVEGAGVSVELELRELPRALPAATAHGAYRIVQESLTNVLRHSGARRALVRVALDGGFLAVEVRDDGRAGSIGSGAPGQGLQGMSERAAALGGRCEAGALADGGWRVRALLPAGTAGA